MTAVLLVVFVGVAAGQEEDNLARLLERVPGIPGEDYPIFSTPPDTSFLCEVQPVEVNIERSILWEHLLNFLYLWSLTNYLINLYL